MALTLLSLGRILGGGGAHELIAHEAVAKLRHRDLERPVMAWDVR